uniref:CreCAP-ShK3 n=1 Tax=Colubraria reticulata TaxID=604273 RepID=A0A481SNK0_9CAEN|nr:CreCAP-ShK3 [Colubraria reticulata]
MQLLSIYILALTSLVASGEQGYMTKQMKDTILKMHNDYRRGEGASNMIELEWDYNLETAAQRWANNCLYDHEDAEFGVDPGENLYFSSFFMGSNQKEALLKDGTTRWFNEKYNYEWESKDCGYYNCHYTQMVWARTAKIGCASKMCYPLRESRWDKYAWFLVCRYYPGGNYIRTYPYTRGGAQCSTCPTPSVCNNGLCKLTAAVDKVKPHISECTNKDSNCDMWATEMNQCETNPKFMLTSCSLACNVCGGGKPVQKADCEDSGNSCPGWADDGECFSNPYWMLDNCKKSCRTCGGDRGSCGDEDDECPSWAKDNECKKNPNWMLVHCKKSCNPCSGGRV